MRRLKFQTGAIASQAPAPPSFSGARKTSARSERKGLRPIAQILLKLTHCPHSLAATLAALPSVSLIPFAPFFLQHSSLLLHINLVCIVETVRGQREHTRKCPGANCNHQQQA